MGHRIDILSGDELRSCEVAGRAALDAALARFSEEARAAIWHSIRCGYVQPTAGVPAPTPPTDLDRTGSIPV